MAYYEQNKVGPPWIRIVGIKKAETECLCPHKIPMLTPGPQCDGVREEGPLGGA